MLGTARHNRLGSAQIKVRSRSAEQSTIEPILRRTAEFEIAIAELEADSYYADSAEGSQREIDSPKKNQ